MVILLENGGERVRGFTDLPSNSGEGRRAYVEVTMTPGAAR
jgi:hypothetical protein